MSTALPENNRDGIIPIQIQLFADASLVLAPTGADGVQAVFEISSAWGDRALAAFQKGVADGLLWLAGEGLDYPVPAPLAFLRDLAKMFLVAISQSENGTVDDASSQQLSELLARKPFFPGSEILDQELLRKLWAQLAARFQELRKEYPGGLQDFLKALHPHWKLVGRVCFHLAENPRDTARPFAFLATYTVDVLGGRAQHRPLSQALEMLYADANRGALVHLLEPIEKSVRESSFLRELLDSKEIFRPAAWTPEQAYRFLRDVPIFERADISVRIPDWWQKRTARPEVELHVGEKPPSHLGLRTLLDFSVKVSLGGKALSAEEWEALLKCEDGLVLLNGRWVEVDRHKLQEVLQHWRSVEHAAAGGMSFLQGMRLLAGARRFAGAAPVELDRQVSRVVAGDWLLHVLEELRNPQNTAETDPGSALRANLRPYQRDGVTWLWRLHRFGMGAVLADDMGLGKTLQVIAFLLLLKKAQSQKTSLLILPASLLGNWVNELDKFAPTLRYLVYHPSAGMRPSPMVPENVSSYDLVLTSYGICTRTEWMQEFSWNVIVLDEAQAIKNPRTQQTLAVKGLQAEQRIALTGTPVENRLTDLWSLFDFVMPGLLGTLVEFNAFVGGDSAESRFAILRKLTGPYLLRRLKTDKKIIQDLPDKTEVESFCFLTKSQAALYRTVVRDFTKALSQVEGMARKGAILTLLLRLKQICNHPSQVRGDGVFKPEDSGKFLRLTELTAAIYERREKVLLFTQFSEMARPLAEHLRHIFRTPGYVLTGQTPVGERQRMVEDFQRKGEPSFFVLTVKAGGTGLNLTAASHVIHFDRWWNPAVENQATDRAFRIGQKRNVLVHKFVCRGTVEEKVAAMIAGKQSLARDVLQSEELSLTELSDAEILNLISLDLNAASEEWGEA